MYGRHGAPATAPGAGHDLFPASEDPVPHSSSGGVVSSETHASMLERQRALAQARSASRLTAAPSVSGADFSAAPAKTSIVRGAPMMTGAGFSSSGPMVAWGAAPSSDRPLSVSSSVPTSAVSSAPPGGKTGSSISDALKEREKKTKDLLGPSDSPSLPSPVASSGAGSMPVPPAHASKDGIMPVAPLMYTPTPVRVEPRETPLDLSDMKRFLTTPTPRSAGIVQCYIERDRSGLTGRLYPTYSMYLKEGDKFLMASKKRSKNKTSNYLISTDKRDLNRESASYLGKLRSNFVGTEFVVFDDGEAPGKTRSADTPLRHELGVVTYASNVLGSRGPRKMKVAVPRVQADGKRTVFQPERDEDSMAELFRNGHVGDMMQLVNKPPKWNEQVGAYVLNFNGRVTMASVKNFQLANPEDIETVLLQFGRTGKDEFSIDYQWPLCPLQAFAIALSSFDHKLACE